MSSQLVKRGISNRVKLHFFDAQFGKANIQNEEAKDVHASEVPTLKKIKMDYSKAVKSLYNY